MSDDRGIEAGAEGLALDDASMLLSPMPAELGAGTTDEVAQQLKRLAVVTDILRGWIWETDVGHRFTYLSSSVQRFAGKAPAWHYGKTRQELGNLNTSNAEHHHYLRQLDNHSMFGPIDFVRYQNGQQFWMRTIGMPQFDVTGQFTGYCGLAFDVSAEIDARQGNRRTETRKRIARTATISQHGVPAPVPCIVLDISGGGARLDVHERAEVPQMFKLMMDLEGVERTCEVVWRAGNSVGIRFIENR